MLLNIPTKKVHHGINNITWLLRHSSWGYPWLLIEGPIMQPMHSKLNAIDVNIKWILMKLSSMWEVRIKGSDMYLGNTDRERTFICSNTPFIILELIFNFSKQTKSIRISGFLLQSTIYHNRKRIIKFPIETALKQVKNKPWLSLPARRQLDYMLLILLGLLQLPGISCVSF